MEEAEGGADSPAAEAVANAPMIDRAGECRRALGPLPLGGTARRLKGMLLPPEMMCGLQLDVLVLVAEES